MTFAVCANTLRGRKMDLSSLVRGVTLVPAGVAEVVSKQEAGWSYIKGGF